MCGEGGWEQDLLGEKVEEEKGREREGDIVSAVRVCVERWKEL